MARNSSGTHSLPSAAPNPVVSGTTITSTWANTTLGDISTEITDSLSRSGKGGMTAPLRCADGTVAAPAHSFTSETGSGWFRHAAGELRLAILGVYRLAVTATGAFINGTLQVASTIFSSGTITATGAFISKSVTSAKLLSVKAPDTLAADYEITLPAALPGSTLPVTLTSAGVMSTGQITNAQQNFGTPSAATDVAIKSYVDNDQSRNAPAMTWTTPSTTDVGCNGSVQYAKLAGIVYVHVLVATTGAGGGTGGAAISAGYRPARTIGHALSSSDGNAGLQGQVTITSGGSLNYTLTAMGGAQTTYATFSYPAEN